MRKQGLAVWFLSMISIALFAETPANFNKAKAIALSLFAKNPLTLYCGCRYSRDKAVDLENCQMHQAKPIERANRIEWEHMMPASQFGRHLQCWRENLCINQKTNKPFHGRKCCQKVSEEFRLTESELFNLWPAVGVINQARSNYNYAELVNKRGLYGCPFDIEQQNQLAEPPNVAKGVVARANLFMSWKYEVALSPEYKYLLLRWNKRYPPSKREIQWAEQVAQIEGYPNPYIFYYEDDVALERHISKSQNIKTNRISKATFAPG